MSTPVDSKNRKLRPHRKRLWLKWKPAKPPKHMRPLPKSRELMKTSAKTIWHAKWLLLKITLVYIVLHLLFVRGFTTNQDVGSIKTNLEGLFNGNVPVVASSLGILGYLAGSVTTAEANNSAAGYQLILFVIVSLAVIWALRQSTAGHKATFKKAYYAGMQPAVPFLIVLFFMALQTLPAVLGAVIYTIVITNGIAVYWYEYIATFIVVGGLLLLSIKMLTASLVALYIVTLPNMTPVKAFRSAHRLTRFRRLAIVTRLVLFMVVIAVIGTLIMLPFIIFLPVAAPWAIYVLSLLAITALHVYLYNLYRDLIDYAPGT